MQEELKMPHYFLGANAPVGFISFFEQLLHLGNGWHLYILKGGPGTGKSTLMKRIAASARDRECPVEYIHCPSSPDSLDAILLPEQKIGIVDGTAPHALEPQYPGVTETLIDLGTCWNSELLREQSEEIIRLTDLCASAHNQAQHLCRAAGVLLASNEKIALESVNLQKLHSSAARYEKKIPAVKTGDGRETFRYLSALTPKGLICFPETVSTLADTIYLVEDEYGAVSHQFLDDIRTFCLEKGLAVISCPCPMSMDSALEGVLLPDSRTAFLASNSWHTYQFPQAKTIHARRFANPQQPQEVHGQRLRFCRRLARELLHDAASCLARADKVHCQLEAAYGKAMDFSKADFLCHMLQGVLLGRPDSFLL